MTLVIFGVATLVPRLSAMIGNRNLLLFGVAATFAGLLWIAQTTAASSYLLSIASPMVLFGAGEDCCFGPLTTSGIAGTDEQDAGEASGLVNINHQIGMSFGLSLLIAVSALCTREDTGTAATVLFAALIVAWSLVPRRSDTSCHGIRSSKRIAAVPECTGG